MNKEFIPYKEALALKELEFDEGCLMWYNKTELVQNYNKNTESWQSKKTCSAPLYQQAFRWFREKHGYFTSPTQSTKPSGSEYDWLITKEMDESRLFIRFVGYHQSYEEAELECIKKLIELCKKK